MSNIKIILASQSPRRRELLSRAGLEHTVIVSEVEEKTDSDIPEEVVKQLSFIKAEAVYNDYEKEHPGEDFMVIGADTVVSAKGRILGKPKDDEEAYEMISMLEGDVHQVYSGVSCLIHKNDERFSIIFAEKTDVFVNAMTDNEINAYIDTGDCYDKAGSYGIQGVFGKYVSRIEGDYNNVVGLPVARLYKEIKDYI